MWTDEKQQQFNALRDKELAGTLTVDEQQQLDVFFAELDAEEAEMLRPAMERMDADIAAKREELAKWQAMNAVREKYLAQRAALLARAQATLAELQAEERALQFEYEKAIDKPIAA
jgi:uncharacterized protein YdaU (DUF1376 family)